jgi:1-acyl-sn-glycerol-3-phosphate acyltransferase
MVSVSTAYVIPHRPGALPLEERLVPLPRSADSLLADARNSTKDTETLLAETGHPNTYTWTKNLAEHLLVQRRGDVPLLFVRPSIISSSWQYPVPGWIDSLAAFAGFVSLIGAGYLRTVVADPSTRLDVVPVDVVADRILSCLDGTFPGEDGNVARSDARILHAVAGVENCPRVDEAAEGIESFFRSRPIQRWPKVTYIGPAGLPFRTREMVDHRIPGRLVRSFLAAQGNEKTLGMAEKLKERLHYINRAFPYFTSHTFRFDSSLPMTLSGFTPKIYVERACGGIHRYPMRQDPNHQSLAGKRHRAGRADLAWAWDRPGVDPALRGLAYLVGKFSRRCLDDVTFDRESFERARAAVPWDHLLVIVPSHRSYLDFLVCSYLFFAHPELGIAIPHIAAAREFSKIRGLSPILTRGKAFYLDRGKGREDPELTRQVNELVRNQETLQFFIEGKRSRSRQCLPPKRGLLRCLQASGQKFSILPVSVAYDRVPEEATLLAELQGGQRPEMELAPLMRWFRKMFEGKVQLGRMHLTCGVPQVLGPDTDVVSLSHGVVSELQENLATTTHHLDAFLGRHAHLDVTVEQLRVALETRGATVLDSPLVGSDVAEHAELCLRYPWAHRFYAELSAHLPEDRAIAAHIEQNSFAPSLPPQVVPEPWLASMLDCLAAPIRKEYERVEHSLQGATQDESIPVANDLLVNGGHLPYLESAFEDFLTQGVLVRARSGELAWGPRAPELREAALEGTSAKRSKQGASRRSRRRT